MTVAERVVLWLSRKLGAGVLVIEGMIAVAALSAIGILLMEVLVNGR